MKFGRDDYDERIVDTADLIPADEPAVLLRARDVLAVEALRFYVKKARAMRSGGSPHLAPSEELLQRIGGQADRMEMWAADHGGFRRPTLPGEDG